MDTLHNPIRCKADSSPLRIFVVEDSAPVRALIIENVMSIPGLVVVGFSDAESDAMVQLQSQQCDVCILDIQLKQGNGLNLLRRLAAGSIQPDILHIIFSNNVDDTCRREGARYGVQHFFDKASDFLQLRELLKQLVADPQVS